VTRVLIWVQHLLGSGHLERMRWVAEALASRGAGVWFATGGVARTGRMPRGVNLVQLPPISVADARFTPLLDAAGQPLTDAYRGARREALFAAFAAARPDVVVLETWPFGRRAFAFELEPLLARLSAIEPRPRVVASVRDLLQVRGDPARDAAAWRTARTHVDEILVHGDPAFARLEDTFPPAADGAVPVTYTGYVVAPDARAELVPVAARGEIVAAASSGDAGTELLAAAIAARALSRYAASTWRVLVGPGVADAACAALVEQGRHAGVIVERHRPDYRALVARARVSVSQAGYNTIQDVLGARTPAVLVPFAAEGETEQAMRAERLAARGFAEVVAERDLAPAVLAAAIDRAAARGVAPACPFATDGAARSAERIVAIARPRLGAAP
jgi:predicted glycosyltransferase